MALWKSGDVRVNGIRLHYTRTGGDLPPLVLAHGFSDDGPCAKMSADSRNSASVSASVLEACAAGDRA